MDTSTVAIVRYEKPFESVRKAVELSNGLNRLPSQARVFIKPNIVFWTRSVAFPKWGVITTSRVIEDMVKIRNQYQVPTELQSCHTAIVDGYIVEGHVPVAEINRLLAERPDVLGIAVAGMPAGSPGMDIEGFDSEPYDVVTFDAAGKLDVYASYPK